MLYWTPDRRRAFPQVFSPKVCFFLVGLCLSGNEMETPGVSFSFGGNRAEVKSDFSFSCRRGHRDHGDGDVLQHLLLYHRGLVRLLLHSLVRLHPGPAVEHMR